MSIDEEVRQGSSTRKFDEEVRRGSSTRKFGEEVRQGSSTREFAKEVRGGKRPPSPKVTSMSARTSSNSDIRIRNRTEHQGIVLSQATRRFGAVSVLNGVDLIIPAGQVVGVMGANGAGKSTMLRVIANVLRLHGGQRSGPSVTAYLPPTFTPPPLTSIEWMQRIARISRSSLGDAHALLERFSFEGSLDGPMQKLSTGNQRKVMLAVTLSVPSVPLVLDEPCAALDAIGQDALREELRTRADRGTAIVVAEHDAAWLDSASEQVFVLKDGRAIADIPSNSLVEMTFRGPKARQDLLLDRAASLGFHPSDAKIREQLGK
jgi:ABC-2 type transport system ATP-binding protein